MQALRISTASSRNEVTSGWNTPSSKPPFPSRSAGRLVSLLTSSALLGEIPPNSQAKMRVKLPNLLLESRDVVDGVQNSRSQQREEAHGHFHRRPHGWTHTHTKPLSFSFDLLFLRKTKPNKNVQIRNVSLLNTLGFEAMHVRRALSSPPAHQVGARSLRRSVTCCLLIRDSDMLLLQCVCYLQVSKFN